MLTVSREETLKPGLPSSPFAAFVCSYTPLEVLHAAGLPYFRLLGEAEEMDESPLLSPTLCPLVRSLMSEIEELKGNISRIVLVNSCNNLQHLYNAVTASLPHEATYMLDVPRRADDIGVEFFAKGLRQMAKALGTTESRLKEAVGLFSLVHPLLRQVESLQAKGLIPGSAVLSLFQAYDRLDPEAVKERAESILDEVQPGPRVSSPRLIVSGGFVREGMVQALEEMGAVVVGIDLCNGSRALPERHSGDSDIFRALARSYLTGTPCPRMLSKAGRMGRLARLANLSGAQGIIYFSVKFCDNHLFDYPLVRGCVSELGLPILHIEWDQTMGSMSGQIKTRLEAFLEMLST